MVSTTEEREQSLVSFFLGQPGNVNANLGIQGAQVQPQPRGEDLPLGKLRTLPRLLICQQLCGPTHLW